MRFGLFCTYENPTLDFASAYADQSALVRLAEDLGFEEAWVAEHHFNPGAASPSCLTLLAHLAALTQRIRLGSAAVLLPLHNPITVAEDAATVDILSGGRLDLGVAKGGPFPLQYRHYGIDPEEARERSREALALIRRLLSEPQVSFEGRYYKVDGLELVPRPVQAPIPIHVATSTPETVELAAAQGDAIMAAPPFPLMQAKENIRLYRAAAPEADPRFTLIRFLHLAPTRAAALAEASDWLRPFVERMRKTTQVAQPGWTPWFDLDRLLADSLIGTEAEVAHKIAGIQADLAPRTLLLKPLSPDVAKRRADLIAFAERIRTRSPAAA